MDAAAVQLVEVAPRDGLQNEPRHLGPADKLDLIGRVLADGARRVEVTGFARPDVVPALADAEAVTAGLPTRPDVEYSALVLNLRSYERAHAAGLRAVNLVVLASETFSRRNQRRSTFEVLAQAGEIAARARQDGVRLAITVGAAFGCPFEGEVPLERLRAVLAEVAALAPHEISLADTIGVATPLDVEQRFAALAEIAPEPVARAHFHDTRNTGIANAVAAQRAGVRVFDTALAGIGGCPFAPRATGNLATEDLVYCFERMGLSTGFDLDRLIADAGWLTGRLDTRGSSSLRHAGGFPRPDRASLTPQVLEATS